MFFSAIICFPNLKSTVMTNRDGAAISLWQDSVPYFTGNHAPTGKTYDVVIAGGGITGLSTALLLQQAGKSCVVVEAQTLGFGTTGGTTAHLNTLLDTPYTTIISHFDEKTAKLVAGAARQSIDLVEKNIRTHHIDCGFMEAPGFLFSQTEKQTKELQDIYEACLKVELDVVYSTEIPVPIPFDQALKVSSQAKFHPLEYLYGLARAFEAAGGVIVQHCRVLDVKGDGPLTVETSRGEYKAGALVYATHIPMGVNLLHLRCAPYRSYAMAVKLKSGAQYPQALAYDLYDPYHYYRSQLVNGEEYLVAGGEDHKTAHEDNTEKCFLQLEAHIRKYFQVDHIAYKWSSQYFEPADGLPYIGHLPGHPNNIYVATGYGGNGITYSGVAALVLKSLLLQEENPLIDVFNPNRIKPVAGFTNFVKENADVVKQLMSTVLPADKLESVSELAPGEGKVIRFEGETIGLYKDHQGQLHAVNPTCTHMKCTVEWNGVEQSWDCPCHGARYSYDGKVLTGPASRNLDYIPVASLMEESHK
jgi:glycine/D-amino acid oxidase-like deaminating enzyme/nitrite reductase/ring-hydroxylating ferredoxin subunit